VWINSTKTWSFDAVLVSETYKQPRFKHKMLLYYLSMVTWFGYFCINCPNLGNCVGDVLVMQDLSLYFFDILYKSGIQIYCNFYIIIIIIIINYN
jgi:hypothetical protein